MSNSETPIQETQHAFLVAWGWFAEHLGLIQQLQAVSLKQKHYHHRPQTKVLEFLVAILAGLQHLQEISLAAHPLDKDQAVAQAWEQPAWADYSGVSRRLAWPELGGGQADCPGGPNRSATPTSRLSCRCCAHRGNRCAWMAI